VNVVLGGGVVNVVVGGGVGVVVGVGVPSMHRSTPVLSTITRMTTS